MPKLKKTVEAEPELNAPQTAVLMEVENVAMKGRQLFYEVVKKELKEKGIALDVATFSKCCLEQRPEDFIPCVLKASSKTRLSAERLATDISESLKKAMTRNVKVEHNFKDLIRIAADRKILVGGVSSIDKEATARILADLGLPDAGKYLVSCQGDYGNCPKTNPWLQLARSMSVTPSLCVAVTTSAQSTKAALAARMRTVAVPDQFTFFQDFGGVDVAYDVLNKEAVETIFQLLKTISS